MYYHMYWDGWTIYLSALLIVLLSFTIEGKEEGEKEETRTAKASFLKSSPQIGN